MEEGEGTAGGEGKEKEVIWVGDDKEMEVEEEDVAWGGVTG